MQAFTLHEFIQRSIQLISAYNSGLHIWTEQHGEQVKYCQSYDKSLPPTISREITHLGLANALSHASLVTRSAFTPRRIAISTEPTDLAQYFPSLNNVPFEFNRSHTTIWFDRRFLSQPLPAYEESHASQSVTDTERRRFFNSAPSSNLVGQLEQLIESSLGKTAMGIQLTASMIGTSPRTLQRRLAEEGQDFGRLLRSIRFRTAQRLLQDPAMPISEIARRLSYADSANFIRAFKRWTGVGPSEFRLLHYEDQVE
jgi:AraC-like DNA-binding protein